MSWPDFGRTTLQTKERRREPVSSILAGQSPCAQVVGTRGTVYGSDDQDARYRSVGRREANRPWGGRAMSPRFRARPWDTHSAGIACRAVMNVFPSVRLCASTGRLASR